MSHRIYTTLALTLLIGLTAIGCSKKEAPPPAAEPAAPAPVTQDQINSPVVFKALALGNEIGADKGVAVPSNTFNPGDTLYASVATTGHGKASLKAVWTYHQGEHSALVNETTQEIDASGPANSEFHISKPNGWPTGNYRVDIFLNSTLVGGQDYSVN